MPRRYFPNRSGWLNLHIRRVTLDTPGTFCLGYRINDLNEVPECDTNNNTLFWQVNVQ